MFTILDKEEFHEAVKEALKKVVGTRLIKGVPTEQRDITKEDFSRSLAIEIARGFTDPMFTCIGSFNMTVPSNYSHRCQITMFNVIAKDKSNKICIIPSIRDENFQDVLYRISPGDKYLVKLFQLTQDIFLKDCFDFLRLRSASVVGAQGLSLILQLEREKLDNIMKRYEYIVSGIFSLHNFLGSEDKDTMMSVLDRYPPSGEWTFDLVSSYRFNHNNKRVLLYMEKLD